jgi:hypothetical protein
MLRKKEMTSRNMNVGGHAEEGVKQDQKKSVKERMREKNKKNENDEVELQIDG